MKTAKTGSEKKARLLDLVTSVLEMVQGGKRDAEEVCDVLQIMKNDKDFVTGFGLKKMSGDTKSQLAYWAQFYREVFGIALGISQIAIPRRQPGFNRLILVAQGLTPEKIFQKMKELFPSWKYLANLDTVESVRKTDKTYAIWIRDRVEADEELKNKSVNVLKQEDLDCITLEERLLYGMKFFKETGKHLDVENITLCAGSRRSDGNVPSVRWLSSKVYVYWYGPSDAVSRLRSRLTVS